MALLCVTLPAGAEIISYDIDPTQSQLVLTVADVDFPGAVDGTFLLILSPDLAPGSGAQIYSLDATVEDIHMGFASLTDMTVITDPDTASYGEIADPDPADTLYTLNQVADLILSGTYTPLFGDPEPLVEHAIVCMSDSIFCEGPPDGEGTIHEVTLNSWIYGTTVIPASENPAGVDITVSLTVVADGVPGGPAATPVHAASAIPDLQVRPNPVRVGKAVRIRSSGMRQVEILDIRGRRLLTLHPDSRGGEGSVFTWKGLDAAARLVPPGIYILRGPGSRATARVLVLE